MEAVYFIQLVVFIHSMGREMFIETCLVRVHICYILGVIGSQELISHNFNLSYTKQMHGKKTCVTFESGFFNSLATVFKSVHFGLLIPKRLKS